VRCPRCHRETEDPVPAFCRACGAPLGLADEPPPAPLAGPVAIDRRKDRAEPGRVTAGSASPQPGGERAGPRAVSGSGRHGELADVERSHWDLGRPGAPTRPEPVATPVRAAPAAGPPAGAGPVLSEGKATRVAAPAREPASPDGRATRAAAPAREPASPDGRATRAAAPAREPASSAGRATRAPATAREPTPGGVPDPEVEVLEVHVRRPEPWRRAAAWAVDVLPFALGGAALTGTLVRQAGAGLAAPAVGLGGLLDLVARERVIVFSVAAAVCVALGVYATIAHALAGATLGKRLLRLRIVGPDGERPTLARSAARSALGLLSAGLLGLGFLLALFAPSGRALHDLLARTWVVDAP